MLLGFKRNCVSVFAVCFVAVFKACSVVCDSRKVTGHDHESVRGFTEVKHKVLPIFISFDTEHTQTNHFFINAVFKL